MNRRDFSTRTVACAAALASATPAFAQRLPIEGKQYVKLGSAVSTAAPAGKIDVVEFFWYGCPHCNAFEPALDAWAKRLSADVAFRRLPVAFSSEPFVAHQRIYFALEQLGQLDAMHRKVFYAIHNDKQRLDKPADIAAFMAKNGVDSATFLEAYNSPASTAKAAQAKQLSEAYKIDGVPALGIQGRYYTSGSLAGSTQASLPVADFLIGEVRRGA